MTRNLVLAGLCTLALVGCGDSSSKPTAPASAPKPRIEKGARFVPASSVLWNKGWTYGSIPWDSTRLELVAVDSFWLDTTTMEFPSGGVRYADAARSANAQSRRWGLDTVYVFQGDSVVEVRAANGYRLPTPLEARTLIWGGAPTRYPWGNDTAGGRAWADASKDPWTRDRAASLDAESGSSTCPFAPVGIVDNGGSFPHPVLRSGPGGMCIKVAYSGVVFVRSAR